MNDLVSASPGRFPGRADRFRALVFTWLVATVPLLAQSNRLHLTISSPDSNGWPQLAASVRTNQVYEVEMSSNLVHWAPLAVTHDGLFAYPDAEAPRVSRRFYRIRTHPKSATNDWKNQLLLPSDPFRYPAMTGQDQLYWVKFAILTADPARVVYQDSTKYLFHYDFARQHLTPFLGIDSATFNRVSLHLTNQQVVLGAVLFPPADNVLEYAIQFAGLDPYPPERIAALARLVKATLHSAAPMQAFYMPAFEQSAVANTNRDFFAAQGLPVASPERWLPSDTCYATGWALGRLMFVPAIDVGAAFAQGRLLPTDILLTDGVPADTPPVAGLLSLVPATPNSHVAILARSYGVPFAYLSTEAERVVAHQLHGHEVLLRVAEDYSGLCQIKVVDLQGQLAPDVRAEILALKQPPPLNLAAKARYGAFSASTELLSPEDIRFFGGKAANYGVLRRTVPTNCPSALAFSFDLWDAFLDQTLPGGHTLRAEITARLAPYTNYPPDLPSLTPHLAAIRDLFTQTAGFTRAQQQAIINALRVFDPQRKIRFRSSTNVEDSERFTGAGLYDSYSGCLLDDLDDDTAGPSRCDPLERNERGVFRALRKVYASFYNDQAFLERLRHRVDESQVGMAVLVHHSFPDDDELANGVATLTAQFNPWGTQINGQLVTQLGAVSVTNPDGSALPEVTDLSNFNGYTSLTLKQFSTLVPLGGYVMNWQTDYESLFNLLRAVVVSWRQVYPQKDQFVLDFEYKKDRVTGLVVKQVRQIPWPGTTNSVLAFLLNEPTEFCAFQGEFGDVFANHRGKCRLALQTRNLRLSATNLQQSFYTTGRFDYVNTGGVETLSGSLSAWPNATYGFSGDKAANEWSINNGASRRRIELQTTLTRQVTGTQSPLLLQSDFPRLLTIYYATPVPTLDFFGGATNTSSETVWLVPCPQVTPGSLLQTRVFTHAGGLRIETSFYWPPPPKGIVAGYTAPLVRWVGTRITGLISQPIDLHGYYSQTYRPWHHNFSEDFIFEPRLEAGLSETIRQALTAANIQLLHVYYDGSARVTILGLDGKFSQPGSVGTL